MGQENKNKTFNFNISNLKFYALYKYLLISELICGNLTTKIMGIGS